MNTILATLSILAALVFAGMIIVALAEALDAHRRRR